MVSQCSCASCMKEHCYSPFVSPSVPYMHMVFGSFAWFFSIYSSFLNVKLTLQLVIWIALHCFVLSSNQNGSCVLSSKLKTSQKPSLAPKKRVEIFFSFTKVKPSKTPINYNACRNIHLKLFFQLI